MGRVADLEPKKVFQFFEKICSIPHGSGNMEQISDYLVSFAKERNLTVFQDNNKNVIIIIEASEGYENAAPIMIQGHMDMVTVKKENYTIDFLKDGLTLMVEGDEIYAEGTSLGGDDGIAVAYALALLDSTDISHPRLEIIITTDEEIGLLGAASIDLSMLKGRRLVNLDSEEEGIFLTSCAGGARAHITLPVTYGEMNGFAYKITVSGLRGGHSGVEIHKERGNANVLMGRFLVMLLQESSAGLHLLQGGVADNVIAKECTAVLLVSKEDEKILVSLVEKLNLQMNSELALKDPAAAITMEALGDKTLKAVTGEDLKKVAAMIYQQPSGIQSMSAQIHGLVQTSLNLGIMELNSNALELDYSVRSSVGSEKEALLLKMKNLAVLLGADMEVSGEYPAWEYRQNSPLRDTFVKVYQRLYGKMPKLEAIHAGLECGLLAAKLDDLDCISLGPDMKDIHSADERLSISSVRRVWEFLLEALKEK